MHNGIHPFIPYAPFIIYCSERILNSRVLAIATNVSGSISEREAQPL